MGKCTHSGVLILLASNANAILFDLSRHFSLFCCRNFSDWGAFERGSLCNLSARFASQTIRTKCLQAFCSLVYFHWNSFSHSLIIEEASLSVVVLLGLRGQLLVFLKAVVRFGLPCKYFCILWSWVSVFLPITLHITYTSMVLTIIKLQYPSKRLPQNLNYVSHLCVLQPYEYSIFSIWLSLWLSLPKNHPFSFLFAPSRV